jgi:hypothetical protein
MSGSRHILGLDYVSLKSTSTCADATCRAIKIASAPPVYARDFLLASDILGAFMGLEITGKLSLAQAVYCNGH